MHSFLASSSVFDVAADDIIDWFEVAYSERGSNKRRSEETIFVMWTNYLMDYSG